MRVTSSFLCPLERRGEVHGSTVLPRGERCVAVGVLRFARRAPGDPAAMLASNRALFELARGLGGKLQANSALRLTRADWADHHGEAHARRRRRRESFDPRRVLGSSHGPFASG